MNDRIRLKFNRQISGHTLEIAKLYTAIGNLCFTETLASEYEYDISTKKLVDVLECGANKHFQWNFTELEKGHINIDYNKNNVVVCFSGGKDSLATALKMKKSGKNVFLYHIKGINKSYPDEFMHVIDLAKKIDMPLFIDEIKQSGVSSFKENPIKNQLIASMALDYAILNHIGTTIAFGDFTTDNIYNSQFYESWSDTQEMWDAWTYCVRKYIPTAELIIPFATYNDTLDEVSNNIEILKMVCGCILPYRFRQTTRNRNEMKYEIDLLPNRCGSCWKCCTEYIFLADKNVVPLNKAFYKHCINFLITKLSSVHPQIEIKNAKNAYEAFLHRSLSNSIIAKEL